MPRPDPLQSPRQSLLLRFKRIMRWLALLSIVIAGIAVLLVARGDDSVHIHMLVATALGAGLSVLLGTGLMTLSFLSARTGHDEQARQIEEDE